MKPNKNRPAAKSESFDPADCPCTGGSLDKLIHPAILVVLTKEPMHGYRIAQEIGQMPLLGGQKPDVSGIYRFLKTMENKGFVVSSWDTSESGPAKKAYQITPDGEHCLSRWAETLAEYRDGITRLLKATRQAAKK